MENRLKELKKIYEDKSIPKKYNEVIDDALKNSSRKVNNYFMKRVAVIAISVITCFSAVFVGINVNESFASTLSKIPGMNNIVKIMMIKNIRENNSVIDLDLKQPSVVITKEQELQNTINNIIQNKIDELTEEGKEIAKEYKEAFISTGGNEKDFKPVDIKINYEIKNNSEKYLSFKIDRELGVFNAYNNQFYYNYDLINKREVKLEDIYGKEYKDIINKDIKRQINMRIKNKEGVFFEKEAGFNSIDDDQKFYINDDNNIVIHFDKYEIAPGCEGAIEFVLENNNK